MSKEQLGRQYSKVQQQLAKVQQQVQAAMEDLQYQEARYERLARVEKTANDWQQFRQAGQAIAQANAQLNKLNPKLALLQAAQARLMTRLMEA